MAHRSAGQLRGQSVFRTLIVDDEPIARRVLRDELATYSDIEIVAEAEDGVSAAGLIQKLTPDLIFLDLQMPRMMGLDVIQAVRSTTATIVVVTALSQMLNSVRNSGVDSLAVLRSDAEGVMDETDFGGDISLEQPPNLSFSDPVHRLVSSYRVQGAGHGAKSEASGDALFDKSVVLLHDVV